MLTTLLQIKHPAGLGMLINLAVMNNWQNSKFGEILTGISALATHEQNLSERGLQKQNLLEQLLREQGRREQELLGQVLQKCERRTFFDRVVGTL